MTAQSWTLTKSNILDSLSQVRYIGHMNLQSMGKLVADQRRAKRLTLREVASAAEVGRSTLAALEAGKLAELGFAKLARICSVLDLALEARPLTLERPLMRHRHLTQAAGRELTKAAIEDIIVRGDFSAWRGLVNAARADETGRIIRRVREVSAGLDRSDPRAQAFVTLFPQILSRRRKPAGQHG